MYIKYNKKGIIKMANLLEAYKNRLAISESIHQKSHNGAKMSAQKKLMIASVLNNTSRFLNEAFSDSAAVQKSAIGDWKKFCLNVSTTALPNLILPELMLTQPMTSITGYVTYLRYTLGVNKGGVTQGQLVNAHHRLGKMDEDRVNYTSDRVVEAITFATKEVVDEESGETTVENTDEIVFAWTPVVPTSVKVLVGNEYQPLTADANGKFHAPEGATKVAYEYNNVMIPQRGNGVDAIPTLTANMTHIQLHAKARRIAVYYSQIAAFQAKTDYGYDLGEQLSAQAQGELAYEIDTEGVLLLRNGAEFDARLAFPAYELDAAGENRTYISRSQYYEQFNEILARAKKIIYQRTQKFAPNYMVVGANILTILPYVKGWSAAPASTVNGPYYAGTVDGLKVYVSPSIDENEFFFGVNGSDLQTAAAVYAPYMAIVPTQLLGFADGAMSQGFSTMYDMKLLNTYNRTEAGKIQDMPSHIAPDQVEFPDIGEFSYMLVKGMFYTETNAAKYEALKGDDNFATSYAKTAVDWA